jgi:phosphoglycolate phosphatase
VPAYRLVVFDLDGTLVDSRRDLAESVNQLIVERGGEPIPEELVGRMVGDGAATLVARAFASARLATDPSVLPRFLAIYNGRLLEHTRPYPGVSEMLGALEPRTSLAVLTNKPLAATEAILEGLNLSRYFAPDRVRGGDGPLPRKPDPTALLQLASEASAAPRATLLVGDSLVDWRTARAAGLPVCIARYGFGFDGFPPSEVALAQHVIDAPTDLVTLVS